MGKRFALALTALVLAAAATGCEYPTQTRACLSAHDEPYTVPVKVGKVWVPVTHHREVCDDYEPVTAG